MASIKNHAAKFAGFTAVMVCLAGGPALAADGDNASKIDQKAVEKIVKDYLLKNPKIIVDAIEAHRRNLAAEEERAVRQTIQSRRKEIQQDPDSVVGGNRSGDVTLVEFFDYRCGVCKRVHPIVNQLLKRDGNIRIVYKEWPILGPQSVFASRAAIASRKQGDDKYLEFHDKMMSARQSLTADAVLKIAISVGLDSERLKQDMRDPEIDIIIQRNYQLAQSLKLNGTPSFLIGDTLLRGARDADTMLNMVREARKKS
jgi:protein-disulfide isomerase